MAKNRKKSKRIQLFASLAAVAVLAIALGVLLGGKISGILFSGQDLFVDQNRLPEATPTRIPVTLPPVEQQLTIAPQPETAVPSTPAPTATPGPTPTLDPYSELEQVADTGMMNGIVNIMFIGVDYEAARIDKNWAGKDGNSFHSDVMIVCAVNFNENRVDLISLPRDTYAAIPGVDGVYKLNAALNCGTDGTNYGLFCENGEGFEKVCEAAEWMLGGIPVHYYYAVTMESVKQIVDIVGGVWYNLEGNFDNGGRYYKAGFQFMDGQACLDYMRVRKGGHGQLPTGDSNRVNRQKNMMVTIFRKMKEENMVLKVPEILDAFDGALFTNCTPAQTAALALFGYKLDPDNIGAHSMAADSATLFHWNFVFTRQSDRVKLIKEIYGVDVKTHPKYSLAYGRYTWCKMLEKQYMNICDPLKSYAQKKLDEDGQGYSSSEGGGDDSSGSYSMYSSSDWDLFSEYKSALRELKDLYSAADKEAKKAANRKSNSLNSVSNSLMDQMIHVQDLAISVAQTFGYTKVKNISRTCYPNQTHTNSPWGLNYWDNKKYNAVKVNFN
ncbi:MAG: LCP family protein [Clostridia bacterium]|nr:LCP family protein [Clostridia bacterium]